MIPHAKKDDEVSIVSSYDPEKAKKIKWYHHLLLNRPLKVIGALLIVSILSPLLIYQFVLYASMEFAPPDGHSFGSCIVPRASRLPCGPGHVSEANCHQQCCYDRQNHFCYQRVPSRFSYLILPIGTEWSEELDMWPRFPSVPFDSRASVPKLKLSVDEISPTHLSITYYDPRRLSVAGGRLEEKRYSYHVTAPELNIVVTVNGTSIFNTMRGPTIASDYIWEIAFKLTEQSMYGLGEIPLEPGSVKVIYNHDGGFSSIPLVFAKMNDSYHGLLLDMKTPTEVSVIENNQLVVRTLTTTGMKIHLFTGPKPKDIMREAMEVMGPQKQMEYWMLGAHVCSDVTSTDDEALSRLTSFITNAIEARMPFESHCGIRPIVFEAEPDVNATAAVIDGANILKNAGKRFVPHISPYIRYEVTAPYNTTNSTEPEAAICSNIICEFEEIMLRLPSEDDCNFYIGTAHDHTVVYPDYTSNVTGLLDKLWTYDVELDGAVLENNWPLDDSDKLHNETYLELPYFSEDLERAFNRTPQWDVRRPKGDLYFHDHNAYGSQFQDAIETKFNQFPSLRTWSTSQWMRSDAVVNRQEVPTTWLALRTELVAAALGGISGHWLWSSPICGDTENFDLESQRILCLKWYMAATYFPMIKIHSKSEPRDVTTFQGTHRSIVLNALHQRMSLMPYFYTVLQEGPLLRPMFYQYPFSEDLVDLNTQFSVGDALLIAPNLQPMQSHVHVRMPTGTWYEFWSGLRIESEEGDTVTLTTTEADFITLVRGSTIVPIQKVVIETADLMRKSSPFTLIAATERANITTSPEQVVETDYATGQLHVAENMTVHFTVNGTQLVITAEGDDFRSLCGEDAVWNSIISDVDIYGLPEELNNFDNHRNVNTTIDVCDLKTENIYFTLF